jgi:hypothetical protein
MVKALERSDKLFQGDHTIASDLTEFCSKTPAE